MFNNKMEIEELIEGLIEMTKDNKITWHHIKDNLNVYNIQKTILTAKYPKYENKRTENLNFYTEIDNGYIISIELYRENSPNIDILIVVPSINGVNSEIFSEPQSQLVRLNSLICRQMGVIGEYTGYFGEYLKKVLNTLKSMST